MIAQISGTVEQFLDGVLTLEVGGMSYEVLLPPAVAEPIRERLTRGASLKLVTYHYYQTDPSRSIPVLIGFATRIEKDFFEKFITVSGVGPKAAVRALNQPIPDIARAVDEGDLKFLKSLPGIGEQRAREIIAKLQGKMGRFGLMRTDGSAKTAQAQVGQPLFREEALEVLLQLGYRKDEARDMIDKACGRKAGLASVEELLNEVYRQRKAT
ncbi:MAG: Holliday junction ATP-dependent DNA helicase RuvA [Candidatus Omnitrophica bacterium]|nr:Holliday junction ATP-dependent DNA helicase RuvA [Candidatus Omnitrophota bacterium]